MCKNGVLLQIRQLGCGSAHIRGRCMPCTDLCLSLAMAQMPLTVKLACLCLLRRHAHTCCTYNTSLHLVQHALQ